MKKFFKILIFLLIALNIVITISAYIQRNPAHSMPWYSLPVLLLKISVVILILLIIAYKFLGNKKFWVSIKLIKKRTLCYNILYVI